MRHFLFLIGPAVMSVLGIFHIFHPGPWLIYCVGPCIVGSYVCMAVAFAKYPSRDEIYRSKAVAKNK
jgi:hypothetical protein